MRICLKCGNATTGHKLCEECASHRTCRMCKRHFIGKGNVCHKCIWQLRKPKAKLCRNCGEEVRPYVMWCDDCKPDYTKKVRNCVECGITFQGATRKCNRCVHQSKIETKEKLCSNCGIPTPHYKKLCVACIVIKRKEANKRKQKDKQEKYKDWKDGAVKFYLLEDRK